MASIDMCVVTIGHKPIGPSIGKVPIGIEVPRAVTKFPYDRFLQQQGKHLEERELDEDVMLEELCMVGQLRTLVESMMEADGRQLPKL